MSYIPIINLTPLFFIELSYMLILILTPLTFIELSYMLILALIDRRLGEPLPHQLANLTQAHLGYGTTKDNTTPSSIQLPQDDFFCTLPLKHKVVFDVFL